MNTNAHRFICQLRVGQVYRREKLLSFSKAVDRDLQLLTQQGLLERVAAGLYYKPAKSLFGALPPDDKDLVKSFLKENNFLLYSWNQYNSLGLGLTQLYNQPVVYNRKRHGLFKLGNKIFDFRRPLRGFPKEVTPEFLLVDLVNNLNELAEDVNLVKKRIKKRVDNFDLKKLAYNLKKYGKMGAKKFFERLIHQNMNEEKMY